MNVFRIGDNIYCNLYITPVNSLKFIISLCDGSKEKVQRAAKAEKNEQKQKQNKDTKSLSGSDSSSEYNSSHNKSSVYMRSTQAACNSVLFGDIFVL